MKRLNTGIAMALGGLVMMMPFQDPAATPGKPTVVVGTFDSRAIATAYVRSDEFSSYLAAQRKDVTKVIERAKETGDRQLAAALDALGPAMQKRIHQQGFGTAAVDDIIARIGDRLPRIAEKAGVDVIVSKWALSFHRPAAEFVDVTDLLVAEFHADEQTLKTIRELVATDPIPLDQLDGHGSRHNH